MIRKAKQSNSWTFEDYTISVESSSLGIKLAVANSIDGKEYGPDFVCIHSDHVEELVEALQEAKAMIQKYKETKNVD